MVLVDLQWIKGYQFFADNGDVLAAGTINIYDAGTTSLRTTYSDAAGTVANTLNGSNQIVLAADGRLDESVYIPTGSWKYVLKDSAGTTIVTEDNIEGALDTDALAITEAIPNTPVISKTSDYTIVNGDQGKIINANPTGGTFVLTLPSASTVGDGWRITIRHVGTANQVTIVGVSSQTINGQTSRALGAQYESICLVSDGANWHIDGHAQGFNYGQVPFFYAESRTLTTPPTSPTAGARYIIASSGTPTGLWTGFSNGDVMESDGQGGWIRLVPVEGWHAYDKNANQMCFFLTAWVGLPATDDPIESDLGYALFQDQRADGTDGGTPTASTWTARTLNTEVVNTIDGCSLASNTVTLPAGSYLIVASAVFNRTGDTQIRFKSTTTSTVITGAQVFLNTGAGGSTTSAPLVGSLNLSAEESFKLEYWTSDVGVGTSGLGRTFTGSATEYYASLQIIDLASLQGPQGNDGPQGPQGFAGFKYQYSTTTTQSDPGAGFVRLNNADLSLVTAAVVDATSAETGNPDVSDEIAAWDEMGVLKIAKVGAEQNWVTYDVTDVVDNTGYLSLTLVYRDHAGSFSNTDNISLQFAPKGETGASGSTIPVYDYEFNTATAGDPGSGKVLFNNATLSSATTISISDNDRIAVDRSADIGAWDDDGASSNRGYIYLINATTGARVATFKATGSITDNTTYQTMSVTYVSGSAPANNTRVAIQFVPAGATGAIGGALGSTDNAVPVADGVGGATLKASTMTVGTDGKATVNLSSALTNTIGSGAKISHTTSDTPAAGIGVGLEFEVETASGNNEIGARIDAVTSDVTSTSEDFDLSFKVMTAGAAVAEVFRMLSTGVAYLGGVAAAIILKANGGQTITGGFKVTPYPAGTKSSGTYTPLYSDGNFQTATNGGAHTLAPPADDCTMIIQYTNNASAGAITTSGFTKVTGAFTTTNGDDFFAFITKIGSFSSLDIKALQ